MEVENTCIYAKFGKCKKEDCLFLHPKDICCDKTCEVHFCSKKHPKHCRYFWGFKACRNEESCKFQHNEDSSNTDGKHDILEKKYDDLLAQFKHLKNLCSSRDDEIEDMKQQLHEQALEISVLRSYVLPDDSQLSSVFNQTNDDETSHHDDEKYKETQMIMEDSTEEQKDIVDMDQGNDAENKSKPVQISKKLPKNDFQANLLNIEYLEAEIIKIKDFVSREKMVSKGINDTRQQLKSLKNKMRSKLGKNSSEKLLQNKLETLSEKVMKINSNFKKSVKNELEEFAETCRNEKVKLEKKCLTAGS